MKFYTLWLLIALFFALLKTRISGLEKEFLADTIIIYLTHGCLLSFLLTPALYFIRNSIKKVS